MIFDIIGWIGMILVLVAYILLSVDKIDNGKIYQILNFKKIISKILKI